MKERGLKYGRRGICCENQQVLAGSGGEEKAPGFPALLSLKMPSRSHRTQNPGSKEFCREGLADPERSSEIGAQGQF